MKTLFKYIPVLIIGALSFSCTDFLEKDPLDQFTDDTYWTREPNMRAYAQGFYLNFFSGYGSDYTVFGGHFTGDAYIDDVVTTGAVVTGVPFKLPRNTEEAYRASTWTFDYVRKANVMMEKVPIMQISDESKRHWMGVARFFRAMEYSDLVKRFGDVPFFNSVPQSNDYSYLYKARDPRLLVVDSILSDFKFALENVKPDDGTLQVNKYVVAAYMSRWMLFHASWLKYHGTTIGNSSQKVPDNKLNEYFESVINSAKVVMNANKYSIGNTYNALFSSESLASNPEIIFYREYVSGKVTNALMSYNAIEEQAGGMTKNCIDSYLCNDGLPISQSANYKGNTNPEVKGVFENRDPRLYQCFIDSLRLPGIHIGVSPTGYICKKFLNEEWLATGSPYTRNALSPADCPLIRYAEVLLNYVEAAYESSTLGGNPFKQEDLDMTINVIRKRVLKRNVADPGKSMPDLKINGGAPAVIANGVQTNIADPNRDPSVSAMLWEIRRERRIELLMEGRRNADLNRWGKYQYINTGNETVPTQSNLGAWIVKAKYPATLFTGATPKIKLYYPTADQSAGYVWPAYVADVQRTFSEGEINSERTYLSSIPLTQINLYKGKGYELKQNPGWE